MFHVLIWKYLRINALKDTTDVIYYAKGWCIFKFWQFLASFTEESAGDGFHTKLLIVFTSKEVLSWSAEKWEWTGDLVFAIYLWKTSEYHLLKKSITYLFSIFRTYTVYLEYNSLINWGILKFKSLCRHQCFIFIHLFSNYISYLIVY